MRRITEAVSSFVTMTRLDPARAPVSLDIYLLRTISHAQKSTTAKFKMAAVAKSARLEDLVQMHVSVILDTRLMLTAKHALRLITVKRLTADARKIVFFQGLG